MVSGAEQIRTARACGMWCRTRATNPYAAFINRDAWEPEGTARALREQGRETH